MNNKLKSFQGSVFALAVAGVLAPMTVQAQLEEVIVTAQKRDQSLMDVPLSISAFSGSAC